MTEQEADQLFDFLDEDVSEEVDYNEFLRYTGPYVLPGYGDPLEKNALHGEAEKKMGKRIVRLKTRSHDDSTNAQFDEEEREREEAQRLQLQLDIDNLSLKERHAELKKILTQIGQKSALCFKRSRDVFKYIDGDNSGQVDRQEMRRFFRALTLT